MERRRDPDPTEELEALRARAFRQRERLQALWLQARAEKLAGDQRNRRVRSELEQIRAHPVFRGASAVRRLARAIVLRPRPKTALLPRTPAAGISPVPAAAWDAARFRAELLGRLTGPSGGGLGRDRRHFRLAVAGRNVSGAAHAALTAAGIQARPAGDLADADLVIDPTVEPERIPRDRLRVAWLDDEPEAWLAQPRFDDFDLVLVADDDTRTEVERRSSKRAVVVPPPLSAEGAGALRAALVAWIEAPRVAIHIGPLTWTAAASWGDLPFGRAVQKAFERRGWHASLHVDEDRDAAAAARADLALHIFGVRAPAVRPGQPSVLWIISHPDYVTRELCAPYDVVGVASPPFLDDLRAWLGPNGPVLIPLLQATDPERFFPEPGGPHHDLLFVGSSRKVRRPILDQLADTTHDLAVYGGGWTPELLDPSRLRGEWVPNDELRRYYAGAAVVLSDAYADMREEGFISNRVYDALASGGFVISEPVAGLDETFDGAVVTYADRDQLIERVEHFLAHPDERRARAAAGRRAVLERHTFDHRVDAILAGVEPLLTRATR